jgi:Domain of Unknown Function (DUF1080)
MSKLLIYSLVVVSFLIACNKPRKRNEQASEDSLAVNRAPVAYQAKLTDQQKADGWKLLFDGKSLDGWRFYRNKVNDSWEIVDGILHLKPFNEHTENKRSDLITKDEFGRYEFALEWKVYSQSNTGIIYKTTEEFDEPYLSGPEYQILDDVGSPGKIQDWQKSGAVFGLYAPFGTNPKPVGDWNYSKLVVNGNHIEHWLNGVKVLAYELDSPEWRKLKAASKWNEAKGYGAAKKGHIDLQDHGSEAWFRNIMVRPL